MGRAGLGGIGVGIGLHLEAATSLLRKHSTTAYTKNVLTQALEGTSLFCVATSEELVGSNLAAVTTELTAEGNRWRVHGTKWIVSPGASADYALVLCRAEQGPAIAIVPHQDLTLRTRWKTSGMRSLETVQLTVDALIPDEAVLVRPGHGLGAIAQGLRYERLALAAQALGTAELAIRLTLTHMKRRKQFGTSLYRHQALRLRIAELHSQVHLTQRALYATVSEISAGGPLSAADIAALKATASRLAEHTTSECAHIFGGRGYTADHSPIERLWRDTKVTRLGGGSDEMMWEIVAANLRPDHALYEHWITTDSDHNPLMLNARKNPMPPKRREKTIE